VANLDFEPITIEETEETILQLDGNGAKLRRHKLHDSTPEHVDFTVKDRRAGKSISSLFCWMWIGAAFLLKIIAKPSNLLRNDSVSFVGGAWRLLSKCIRVWA